MLAFYSGKTDRGEQSLELSDAEYEYIKQEVIDLFERYCVRCIPISGFELAMNMGIIRLSKAMRKHFKKYFVGVQL